MSCRWCGAHLTDAAGRPRWDLLGGEFVCRDGCTGRPLVAPYAWVRGGRAVTTAAAPMLAGARHG